MDDDFVSLPRRLRNCQVERMYMYINRETRETIRIKSVDLAF